MKNISFLNTNKMSDAWRFWLKISTLILITLITISRAPSRFFNPLLWYEDGVFFLTDAYEYSFWESVLRPLPDSYYILLNRVLAEFATIFQIEYLPLVYVLCSLATAVFTYGLFLSDLFEWVIESLWVRILFCLALAIMPGNNEIVLRFLNLHWYVGIIAFLFVLMDVPKSNLGKFLYIITWPILALSTIHSICFLPCLAIRAYLSKNKTIWISVATLLLGSLPTIGIVLSGRGVSGGETGLLDYLILLINGFDARILIASVLGLSQGAAWTKNFGIVANYLWYLPYIAFVIYLFVQAARKRSYLPILMWLYMMYTALITILMSGLRREAIIEASKLVSTFWVGERYFILSLTSFYLFVFWWLSKQEWRKEIKIATWTAVTVCLLFAARLDYYDPTENTAYNWTNEIKKIKYAESLDYPSRIYVGIMPDAHWKATLRVHQDQFDGDEALLFSEVPAHGGVDIVASINKGGLSIALTDQVLIEGWALKPSLEGPADKILVFDEHSGEKIAETTGRVERPDVAEVFKNDSFLYAGWRISFPAYLLTPGVHVLQVYAVDSTSNQAHPIANGHKISVINDMLPEQAPAMLPKENVLAALTPGQAIRQEFRATQNSLQSITLPLVATGSSPSGLITFSLQEILPSGENRHIQSFTTDLGYIEDLEQTTFEFPVQVYSLGKRYALTLSMIDASEDSAVTSWRHSGQLEGGSLSQAGVVLDGTLSMQLTYYDKGP
jgi:hypothetical protein